MAAGRRVMWDLVETHLDELAFLSGLWEGALHSPLYPLARLLAGPERRLVANLDGVLVAGPEARERLLEPALLSAKPRHVFAAALALLDGKCGEGLDVLLYELAAVEGERRAAMVRAMELTRWPGLEAELLEAARAKPRLLGPALDVLAFRGHPAPRELLEEAVGAGDPEVSAAGLRAARLGGAGALRMIEEGIEAEAGCVRDAAIASGLRLRAPRAWARCREVVEQAAPDAGFPLLVLGVGGENADVARLAAAVEHEHLRSAALFALGFTGRAAAVDACIPSLDAPEVAPVAGEAISAITGLEIIGDYRQEPGAEPDEPPPFEEEDLDADLAPEPESALPYPQPEAVADWWHAARPGFDPGARCLGGVLLSGARFLDAFAGAPLRRRHGMALELAIRTRGAWEVETRGWAAFQVRAATPLSAADLHRALSKPLQA